MQDKESHFALFFTLKSSEMHTQRDAFLFQKSISIISGRKM